jgi:P4 family phage/plasmid primase-like protien
MMAMVAAIREELAGRGERLMLTEGKVWHYQRGLWSILSPAVEQRIRSRIQHGLVELGQNPKVQTKNQVWSMLIEDPEILVEDVRWNERLVVCENVVLELDQLTANDGIPVVLPHSPDHFARRRINAAYDEQAGCPLTLQWLAEIFADKEDAQAHIDVLQEFFGASLVVRLLPREARKAMMLFGPSNTGKSEVARLLRNLLAGPGSKVSATMAGKLGATFGLEQFYDAVAWICDEAGQVGEFLDAARFKVIVTGEPIAVERKNIGAETLELAMPVLLTMNVLPRVRDQSNAVFNRQINVSLTRVFSDEDAHEWRDRHETDLKPATYLFEKEGSGILVWALEGLHRLLRRGGHYDLPESMKAANREYAEASNPIQAWGADAIRANPLKMVARNDLLCSYHGFQSEMDGSEAKAMGGRGFHPGFKDQFKVMSYQSDSGTRYWIGSS